MNISKPYHFLSFYLGLFWLLIAVIEGYSEGLNIKLVILFMLSLFGISISKLDALSENVNKIINHCNEVNNEKK